MMAIAAIGRALWAFALAAVLVWTPAARAKAHSARPIAAIAIISRLPGALVQVSASGAWMRGGGRLDSPAEEFGDAAAGWAGGQRPYCGYCTKQAANFSFTVSVAVRAPRCRAASFELAPLP